VVSFPGACSGGHVGRDQGCPGHVGQSDRARAQQQFRAHRPERHQPREQPHLGLVLQFFFHVPPVIAKHSEAIFRSGGAPGPLPSAGD
jgi:hypothetical protein